jgi:hypothetical protein
MFWDAMLMLSKVKLELLTDEEMYEFYERGIRGGVSMVSKRHAREIKGENHIGYFDATNLYGVAMIRPLPTHGFKWIEDFNKQTIYDYNDNSEDGYTIEVTTRIPLDKHELFNDYPPMPETLEITPDMVSPYNKRVAKANNYKIVKGKKLVPHLMGCHRYVCNISTLKLYLQLGVELVSIHRVIGFKQSRFMESYIMKNTEERKLARIDKNEFLADFYKMANNAVFGKTMENVRNRENISLFTDKDKHVLKHIASPFFKDFKIINENLVTISKQKETTKLNKPIYVGQTILDFSKEHMYNFHYNVMMKKYNPKTCQLLFTDTDSLCYEIKTKNFDTDFKSIKQHFDFSNIDKNSPLYSTENAGVLGKFKHETKGVSITELVALKPKLYAYTIDDKEKITSKGIKKFIPIPDKDKHKYCMKDLPDKDENENPSYVMFKNFKECLWRGAFQSVNQTYIRSKSHQLMTMQQAKIGLSSIDTKKYLLDNGVNYLAYGHYLIAL